MKELTGGVLPRSYAVEVQADSTGTWTGNRMRFANEIDAIAWAQGLRRRWALVQETRIVGSDEDPGQ